MEKIRWLVALIICCLTLEGFAEVFLEPTAPGHVIEVMVEKPLQDNYPVIVLLHGAKDTGWRSIGEPILRYWLDRGCAVAAISMPGFGKSSGVRDFCGPVTINSLHVALDKIKQELEVADYVLMGFGQGGLAAALLSAERKDIRCTLCTNGIADLLAHQTEEDPLFIALREKGYAIDVHDHAGLIARSPLYHVARIETPMFLLHRKGHSLFSDQEPIAFHAAMISAGKECRLIIKERPAGWEDEKFSFREIIDEGASWLNGFLF